MTMVHDKTNFVYNIQFLRKTPIIQFHDICNGQSIFSIKRAQGRQRDADGKELYPQCE